MEPEIALRLAASVAEDVSIDKAREIVAEYLRRLAECSACGGLGTVALRRDAFVPVRPGCGTYGSDHDRERIGAGTVLPCLRCGSEDGSDGVGGDPDLVAWHCLQGQEDRSCRHKQRMPDDGEHASCGYRLVLEIERPASPLH